MCLTINIVPLNLTTLFLYKHRLYHWFNKQGNECLPSIPWRKLRGKPLLCIQAIVFMNFPECGRHIIVKIEIEKCLPPLIFLYR